MHNYIFENDNVVIYGSYHLYHIYYRFLEILEGHQRYQKYEVPYPKKLKCIFKLNYKKEINGDLKFHLTIDSAAFLQYILIIV